MDNRHEHLLSPMHAGVAGLLVSAVAGCASLPANQTSQSVTQPPVEARASLPQDENALLAGERNSTKNQRRTTQDRVIFSDEVDHQPDDPSGAKADTALSASSIAGALGDPVTGETNSTEDGSLIGALAASYDDDMKALARMQQERDALRRAQGAQPNDPNAAQSTVKLKQVEFNQGEPTAQNASPTPPVQTPTQIPPASPTPQTVPTVIAASETTEKGATPTPATPTPATLTPTTAAPPSSEPASFETAAEPVSQTKPATSAETPTAEGPAAQPQLAANGALALTEPTPIPTEPSALRALLQDALLARAATSDHPLRDWLGVATLALSDPSAALPANFTDATNGPASDLLPAERDRVVQAHAAFALIGKALAAGEAISATDAEALVAALSGGPKIAVPKIEFCTKIEGFGRFTPVQNDRFLAGSKARFIVYSEVSDFTSTLETGAFTTRLATRVSIESERDGVVVWRRSPEWTAVVDSSPTRRGEFFVGEIVTLTEYLSVGGYRLKVEIRDEATGIVGVATRPFVVVADPAMAAVAD